MAELINTNVFEANKKFVDFAGLDYFWEKAKAYVDGLDSAMDSRVDALEGVVGDSESGLVKEVATLRTEVNALGGTGGGIQGMIDTSIAALDLPNTYDAKGAADGALTAAKAYADDLVMVDGVAKFDAAGTAAGLDAAMDARVKVLEAIDHDKLAADASAAAVATVLDGAPEKFDTLKEVAQWIADSESAAAAADLVTRVKALEDIDHDAYVEADKTVLADAKAYADGLVMVDGVAKFDAAGTAAQALADAKADAAKLYQPKGDYEAAGALDAAKAYADGLVMVDGVAKFDAAGSAAAAQVAAIAQAKLDAAEALKNYYTKTEVDNLLSTNSTGDRAYAKQYTDELFNTIKFADNSDIDAIFA